VNGTCSVFSLHCADHNSRTWKSKIAYSQVLPMGKIIIISRIGMLNGNFDDGPEL
jgi:hypothetical protein